MANGVVEPETGPMSAGGWQTLTRPDSNTIRSFMQCRKRGHCVLWTVYTQQVSLNYTGAFDKKNTEECLTWGLWDSSTQG